MRRWWLDNWDALLIWTLVGIIAWTLAGMISATLDAIREASVYG